MRSFGPRAVLIASLWLALPWVLTSCAGPPPEQQAVAESLVIYSGRSESLVGPLLEKLAEQEGIEVEVRYGGTAEMAATLLEEGVHSPADLFLSQDAAALAQIASEGMLETLPLDITELVPAEFASPNRSWVGLSGRARTVVYNPERIALEELPQSLDALLDPAFRGRFGLAPTNASFQAHMAAYAAEHGAEELAKFLAGIVGNEPMRYPKNGAIVKAVIAGEVDFGLVNHYYLWRELKEDPSLPGANFFMPGGGASSFVNLAGVGVLRSSDAALRAVRFLLAEDAQTYFAEETFEYPLRRGVPTAADLPTLDSLDLGGPSFTDVSSVFRETLDAIAASGLVL